LISERDSIIATRHQLVELGQNSFKTFSGQVEVLNQVWTWAMNDASKVKLKLDEIKKDVRDLVSTVWTFRPDYVPVLTVSRMTHS